MVGNASKTTNNSDVYSLEQWVIIIGANIPCVQPVVLALFQKVKSTSSDDIITNYSLDDESVYRGQSCEGSTNAILGHCNRRGFEGDDLTGSRANKHRPHFLHPAPRILRTVDLDVRYGSGASTLGHESRVV